MQRGQREPGESAGQHQRAAAAEGKHQPTICARTLWQQQKTIVPTQTMTAGVMSFSLAYVEQEIYVARFHLEGKAVHVHFS